MYRWFLKRYEIGIVSFLFEIKSGKKLNCQPNPYLSFMKNELMCLFTLCGSFYHFSLQLLSNTSKDKYIYFYSEGYLSISGILCLSHFHFAEAYCGLTGIFFPKYICAAIKKARVLQSISLNLLHFNSQINASSY